MIGVKVTLAAIAFGGLIAAGAVPQAHADAADDYLQEMINDGLGISNAAGAITAGYQLCALLPNENGEHLAVRLTKSGYFQTLSQARAQINAASHHLCPDQDHTGQRAQQSPAHVGGPIGAGLGSPAR